VGAVAMTDRRSRNRSGQQGRWVKRCAHELRHLLTMLLPGTCLAGHSPKGPNAHKFDRAAVAAGLHGCRAWWATLLELSQRRTALPRE